MVSRRHREPSDEEPAVTFEFSTEDTAEQSRDRWSRAGMAAASGGALLSGGAVDVSADTLDVFDDLAAGEPVESGATSLPGSAAGELIDETPLPEFSPLDFSISSIPNDPALAGADEIMFGAVAGVGGGQVIDDADAAPGMEAFTALEPEIAPVEPLVGFEEPDDDDDDDLDLPGLHFD